MKKRSLQKSGKVPPNLSGTHADEFIQAWGNSWIVNNYLKIIVIILILAVLSSSYAIVSLTNKVNEVKPLPIFIDRISGSAVPVDFSVIDAEGSKRHKSEVLDFSERYIEDLYTFNSFTVKSNLKSALDKTSEKAIPSLKEILRISNRAKYINNHQGMVNVKSIVILSGLPDVKVQVFFEKKVLLQNGSEVEITENIAILRMKTVLRQKGNAHGLYVVEYRESEYKIEE